MTKKPAAKNRVYKPKPQGQITIIRTLDGEILVGIALKEKTAQEKFSTYKEAIDRVSDVLNANKTTNYKVTFWGINPEHEEKNA